jgi:hypothetical protein
VSSLCFQAQGLADKAMATTIAIEAIAKLYCVRIIALVDSFLNIGGTPYSCQLDERIICKYIAVKWCFGIFFNKHYTEQAFIDLTQIKCSWHIENLSTSRKNPSFTSQSQA